MSIWKVSINYCHRTLRSYKTSQGNQDHFSKTRLQIWLVDLKNNCTNKSYFKPSGGSIGKHLRIKWYSWFVDKMVWHTAYTLMTHGSVVHLLLLKKQMIAPERWRTYSSILWVLYIFSWCRFRRRRWVIRN